MKQVAACDGLLLSIYKNHSKAKNAQRYQGASGRTDKANQGTPQKTGKKRKGKTTKKRVKEKEKTTCQRGKRGGLHGLRLERRQHLLVGRAHEGQVLGDLVAHQVRAPLHVRVLQQVPARGR